MTRPWDLAAAAILIVIGLLALLVAAGEAWGWWDRRRQPAAPPADGAWWWDTPPARDPDPHHDPACDEVDQHADTAIALLTPDALPPCRCEVCTDLTDDGVDYAIDGADGLEEHLAADIAAGLYDDVTDVANRLLPPVPPVIPGRPEQGDDR